MTNPFGGFNVTTPLSSHPHNPIIDLSSNCIRDYFGSTCQSVFDCLQLRGKSSLPQLIVAIRSQCKRDINPERLRLVDNLAPLSKGRNPVKINMARGSEEHGFIVDASSIRAALIVLLQHSMIKASPIPKANSEEGVTSEVFSEGKNSKYCYYVDIDRSLLLPRYSRYIEFAKKTYHEEGAAIVEELLVHGRMLTEEIIVESTESLLRYLSVDGEAEISSEQKVILAQKVMDSLMKLIEQGHVEMVKPIDQKYGGNQQDETKIEDLSMNNSAYDNTSSYRKKRPLNEISSDAQHSHDSNISFTKNRLGIDIPSMINMSKYKQALPHGAVWRVNVHMFHASLRAFYVGRLVAERYGHEKSFGAIVSASLKYIAYKVHSPGSNFESDSIHQLSRSVFTPDDIMPFLPSPILADMTNKPGGAQANLSAALVTLSKFTYPQVICEIEETRGHPQGGKFEITIRQVMSYLKGVIFHSVIKEHFGDVAARICSIVQAKGHLESDTIAESAMVPAKDARELLHRLYKANYISLFYLQQSKQHNPANAMYLWYVDNDKMNKTILLNTCKALYNMRLRRQHEVEVGKDWIERAKEAGATDENDSELDKLNYNKFCQGLERLDNACLQLDEILMLLKDFDK